MKTNSNFKTMNRQQQSHRIAIAVIVIASPFVLERCGDKFMSSKVKNESKGSFNLASTADAAGNYTGAMDPNSTSTQVLRATSGDLSGSAIAMPPGALGINLSITIGSGETLASSDVTQQLGLSNNSASAAGPAVSFVPSTNVQASNPFTLSIPVSATSLALSALSNDNLVVMYKWMKVDSAGVVSYAIGIIPRDSLTVGSKTVQFQTTKFGTFQLAVTQTKITEPVSKPTVEPPMLKADVSNPLVGVWSQCQANNNSSSSTSSGTSGTATSVDENGIRNSIDQNIANWIIAESAKVVKANCSFSPATNNLQITFHVQNTTTSAISFLSHAVKKPVSASDASYTSPALSAPALQTTDLAVNFYSNGGAYTASTGPEKFYVQLDSPECHYTNAGGAQATPGFNVYYFDSSDCQQTVDVICDGKTIDDFKTDQVNIAKNAAGSGTSSSGSGSSSTTQNNQGGGRDNLGLPPGANAFAREYVKFSAATFIHSRSVFSDANCTGTMISRTEESGSYKLGAIGSDSIYPISITFAGSNATIFTPQGVSYANGHPSNGGCGISDWVQGTARDITTSSCEKDSKGSSGPTKVKIQGKNIYFNDSGKPDINTKDSMTREQ